ncbi:MAG: MotA/TolQ/ExbB proton channel family protein, partial [Rhodospirillales bacterium]|nr:MotA/TolQ/ExbB proton channel family protein [Rhodospirillales bacterium]
MDFATLVGLVSGVGVVVLAIATGSDLGIFLNLTGILIVLGGTFAATLIKFPLTSVFGAFKLAVMTAFIEQGQNPRILVEVAEELAQRVRKGNMLALENAEVDNRFFQKGIQLCVDGHNAEFIEKVLTTEMDNSIHHHEVGEKIFRAMGESAPAFGMIGTLVGLVQMLSSMDDPKTIGPAMAVALLTTLYGALIANLVALPIAEKLNLRRGEETFNKALIIEGVMAIQQGQNPHMMEEIMEAYLSDAQKHRDDEPEKE